MVDAPDIVAEVTQLETALSLCLHLVKAPLHKTFHYFRTRVKMIYWPGVDWITYTWHSRDVADESGSHLDNHPSDPSQEGIASPLMQIAV
jgi:hypothetical protein